jgi:hypothetical protein
MLLRRCTLRFRTDRRWFRWSCDRDPSPSRWWIDFTARCCFHCSLLRFGFGRSPSLFLIRRLSSRHYAGSIGRACSLHVFSRVCLWWTRLQKTTCWWSSFGIRTFSRGFGAGVHCWMRAGRYLWWTAVIRSSICRREVIERDLA